MRSRKKLVYVYLTYAQSMDSKKVKEIETILKIKGVGTFRSESPSKCIAYKIPFENKEILREINFNLSMSYDNSMGYLYKNWRKV